MFQFVSRFEAIENVTNYSVNQSKIPKEGEILWKNLSYDEKSQCILKIAWSTFPLKLVLQHIIELGFREIVFCDNDDEDIIVDYNNLKSFEFQFHI